MRRRAWQIVWPLALLLLVAALRLTGCRKSEPAGDGRPTRTQRPAPNFTPPPSPPPITYPPGVPPPAPTFPG